MKYFISYMYTTYDGKKGVGNCVTTHPNPIRNYSDINILQTQLNHDNDYKDCIITNYIPIPEDE